MLQPYLKHSLIQIEKEILLLEALVPPISRIVYDSVVKYNDVEELFQVLEQRQAVRAKTITGVVPPQYNDMSTSLRNVCNSYYYFSIYSIFTITLRKIILKENLILEQKFEIMDYIFIVAREILINLCCL